MGEFSGTFKSAPRYLEIAANGNGGEKSFLPIKALERLENPNASILEIGPGGGAAIESLVKHYQPDASTDMQLTLVEKPDVNSDNLDRARSLFQENLGRTVLLRGDACRLDTFVETGSQDLIIASAVMHEIYSYSDRGYRGLNDALRSVVGALRPGGYFAYRDVYAVKESSLHSQSIQSYGPQSWLRFMRNFVPNYLENATHPYHHLEDELKFRQDSKRVKVEELDTSNDTIVEGPVGMLREVQRHYITFRDHVWRSGMLGFKPVLDGSKANDWLDEKNGHKRVHFTLTDSTLLTRGQLQLLGAMSERADDELIIDGDIFDEVTDTAINSMLGAVENGDEEVDAAWREWLDREGNETYAYMCTGQLIGNVALQSLEVCQADETILLPVQPEDVLRVPRSYYNRLLQRRLPNPLYDGKQLILFKNIPLKDVESVQAGLAVVQEHCTRSTLANLFSAINGRV